MLPKIHTISLFCNFIVMKGGGNLGLSAMLMTTLLFACQPLAAQPPTLCSMNTPFLPDITVGAGQASVTLASTVWPTTTVVSSKKIKINGTLIMDKSSLIFSLCQVSVADGGRILVQTGKLFRGSRTDFFACGVQWQGVAMETSASLRLDNCKLEDAEYAIRTGNGAQIHLIGNSFNRNHIGVFTRQNGSPTPNTVNFTAFRDNNFSCASPLNAPYPGQQTTPGTLSYAGIDGAECTMTVGEALGPNTFTQMQRGITAKKAQITVVNCRFQDMQPNGRGIHIDGGSLWVGDPSTSPPCQFQNCDTYGIYARVADLNVRGCAFSGHNVYGIFSEDNTLGEKIDVRDNTILMINDCYTGIYVERPTGGGGSANIWSNLIQIPSSYAYAHGIRLLTLYPLDPSDQTAVIFRNKVKIGQLEEGATGISVEGKYMTRCAVEDNDVTFDGTRLDALWWWWGIALINTTAGDNSVGYNSVSGPLGPPYAKTCGIFIQNGTNTSVCKNSVWETSCAFYFTGHNNHTSFSENTLGSSNIGLYVDGGPTGSGMGKQLRRQNRWPASASYPVVAALCSLDPDDSRFEVSPPQSQPLWPPSIDPPGWFSSIPGDTTGCGGLSILGDSLTKREAMLLAGELEEGTSLEWDTRRGLVLKLMSDPSLLEVHPLLADFAAAEATTDAGQSARTEWLLAQALNIPADIAQALADTHTGLAGLVGEVLALPTDTTEPTDSADTELAAERTAILLGMEALRVERETLQAALLGSRAPLLADAMAHNALWQATTPWAVSRRALDGHLLHRAGGGGHEPDLLASLALQDPDADGDAVVEARTLVRAPELTTIWSVIDMPEGVQALIQAQDQPTNFHAAQSTMAVWPNPATDQVTVHLPQGPAAQLAIYDAQGRCLHRQAVPPTDHPITLQIATASWARGFYYCALHGTAPTISTTLSIR